MELPDFDLEKPITNCYGEGTTEKLQKENITVISEGGQEGADVLNTKE